MDGQLSEFGRLFTRFLQAAMEAEPDTEPEFRVLVREHLGADPRELPIIGEQVHAWAAARLGGLPPAGGGVLAHLQLQIGSPGAVRAKP